jgi:hypothetical protein
LFSLNALLNESVYVVTWMLLKMSMIFY